MSFDFSDNYEHNPPIYIRKKTQSCSDFEKIPKPHRLCISDHDFSKWREHDKIEIYRTFSWKDDLRSKYEHFDKIHCNDIECVTFSYDNPAIKKEEDDPEKSKSSEDFTEEWQIEDPQHAVSAKSQLNYDSFSYLHKSPPKTFSAYLDNIINNLFENPEGRMKTTQRIAIFIFTAFEAYRTLISSFLTVFVPQNCGGYSCTIIQNIVPKDGLEQIAITINAFMAFYFCLLFATEQMREDIIKTHLIPDKTRSTDKEYLIIMLSEMKLAEQKNILRITRVYRRFAQFLLLLFFVNASISCVVIRKNYLNNTTATVFITNTFFMINRIYKTLKITSSGEYNIYSAYRTENLLYNRYRGENGQFFQNGDV